jgi:hypothetical protein
VNVFHTLSERARRLLNKRLSYRQCFCNPDGSLTSAGARVFRDLALYSGAYKTTFRADPLEMAKMAGRREMFLKLQGMVKLPDEEFLKAIDEAQE